MPTATTTRAGAHPVFRPHTRGTRRTRPVSADEIIDWKDNSGAYARLFRAALREALDETGRDDEGVTLAYSRAASRTWEFSRGLSAEAASGVRLGTFRDLCAEDGLAPLRAGIGPGDPQPVGADTDLRVPRAHALDGRVRNSGRRR